MTPLVDKGAPGLARLASSQVAGWADVPCAHVTQLVASILSVPIALLSLPRADEYRFRVNIGLEGFESVPCRISFCAYTQLGTDVLVVPDARNDARFLQNPLVLGEPRIVAYVGVPLISSRGVTLGTLCAIDHVPRTFDSVQLDLLREVARIAAWLLEAEAAHRAEQLAAGSTTRKLEERWEAEREQLAVALHEGVAQDLFALRLQLQQPRGSGALRPESDAAVAAAGVSFMRALDRSISDVCELASGLMPEGPGNLRVIDAIRQHAGHIAYQTGLEIQVAETGRFAQIDSGSRLLVLRAAREALASVARHASACRVSITLDCGEDAVRLRVADDGVGVAATERSHPGGEGFEGLRERVVSRGGTLGLERNACGGTTLDLHLPRAPKHLR